MKCQKCKKEMVQTDWGGIKSFLCRKCGYLYNPSVNESNFEVYGYDKKWQNNIE